MEKLQPIDVLYSLVGVNKRLNIIVGNVISRSTIYLVKISPTLRICSLYKSELDRLCLYTLPQMHHHIKMMFVESSSGDYPNLYVFGFVGLTYARSLNYFSGMLLE